MNSRKSFYVWAVPLVWAACSFFGFKYRGDEYGMYAVSAMPGVWLMLLTRYDNIHSPLFPLMIVLGGAPIFAGFGAIMDWLRVRKWLAVTLWGIAALVLLTWLIALFTNLEFDLERAIRKNGSIWAYVFAATSAGLYVSVLLSIARTAVQRVCARMRWEKPALEAE